MLAMEHSPGTVRLSRPAASTQGKPRGADALTEWQIKRIRRHVDAHLNARVKCTELAKLVGLSRSHFGRKFRGSFGVTPHAYVTRRRIEHARDLIRGTTMPLAEVALECGMSDQSHLTRIFSAMVGAPPATWRRSLGHGEFGADASS